MAVSCLQWREAGDSAAAPGGREFNLLDAAPSMEWQNDPQCALGIGDRQMARCSSSGWFKKEKEDRAGAGSGVPAGTLRWQAVPPRAPAEREVCPPHDRTSPETGPLHS